MTFPRARSTVLLACLLLAPLAVAGPSPTGYYLQKLVGSLAAPEGVLVLIATHSGANGALPPPMAFYGDEAVSAVRAWDGVIRYASATHPQLEGVTLTPVVVGRDPLPEDLGRVRIVVTAGKLAVGGVWQAYALAQGLPPGQAGGTEACVVAVQHVPPAVMEPRYLLREQILRGIGKCLGLGPSGVPLGSHCNAEGQCYDAPAHDAMAAYSGPPCVTTLNVAGLAEAYAWRAAPGGAWAANDGETYLAKAKYACAYTL